jgi:hypothetical protein
MAHPHGNRRKFLSAFAAFCELTLEWLIPALHEDAGNFSDGNITSLGHAISSKINTGHNGEQLGEKAVNSTISTLAEVRQLGRLYVKVDAYT